ncbi:MAG TPA: hypothetical protein VKY74_00025 [Chloroflexia bacterium]|nr:hypothetical protein [Chloroflexia bacterium]
MSIPPPPGAATILAALIVLAACAIGAAYLLRHTRQDWPVIGALATLCFGFALAYDSFLPDDSYITYRYAHNLLQGQGLVFNPGEYVLSTTTPLYTLLLAVTGLGWPDLPTTSHILSLPALFAGALVLYLLCARHGKAVVGLLLGALYIVNPLTAAVYSSESILHVALIFGALYAYDQDRLEWAAALCALAVLNRGDGALIAIALGLHWLLTGRWRGSWRPALRALAIYAAVSLPWYGFSWLYYGSLAPATLGAKIAQSALPGTVVFGPGLGARWMGYARQSLGYWLLPPLALLGFLLAFPRSGDRWAAPTLLWAGLYLGGYTVLAVPDYQNYYTPLAPVLLLLALLGAHWLGVALAARLTPGARPSAAAALPAARLAAITVLACGTAIGLAFGITGAALYPRLPQARAVLYQQIGDWLRLNTPPRASVGLLEVGTMSYYAERRVIDFYGLIQPDVADHLSRRETAWPPQHYQPDYIVIHTDWVLPFWQLGDPQFDTWFQTHYRRVRDFQYDRCDCSPMSLYARR